MHYQLLGEANKTPEPSCDTACNRQAALSTHTHLKTPNSKAEADRNHLTASESIQISARKK